MLREIIIRATNTEEAAYFCEFAAFRPVGQGRSLAFRGAYIRFFQEGKVSWSARQTSDSRLRRPFPGKGCHGLPSQGFASVSPLRRRNSTPCRCQRRGGQRAGGTTPETPATQKSQVDHTNSIACLKYIRLFQEGKFSSSTRQTSDRRPRRPFPAKGCHGLPSQGFGQV